MRQANDKQGNLSIIAVCQTHVALRISGSGITDDTGTLAALGQSLVGHTSLGILLEATHFCGWQPESIAHTIWHHARTPEEYRRLAIVCDTALQCLVVDMAKPLFSNKVRVFASGDALRAHAWLTAHSMTLGALGLPCTVVREPSYR